MVHHRHLVIALTLVFVVPCCACTHGVAVFDDPSSDDPQPLDMRLGPEDGEGRTPEVDLDQAEEDVFFVERDGRVVIEAEHFERQDMPMEGFAQWVIQQRGEPVTGVCISGVTCDETTWPWCNEHPECDGDTSPVSQASGEAYVEALPDRLRSGAEVGLRGLGRTGVERGAVLHYPIRLASSGRYYVWVRAYTTNGADDVMFVGINGAWPVQPTSGIDKPMLVFVRARQAWVWSQRYKAPHDPPPDSMAPDDNLVLDIATAGEHTLQVAVRDDGFEFDKLILTRDPTFVPEGVGPAETRVIE